LNRQVVKSDTATFQIPSLEFEQPPSKKGGKLLQQINDLQYCFLRPLTLGYYKKTKKIENA